MTLKEKFRMANMVDNGSTILVKYQAIADEFAIEFAEWAIAKSMGVAKFTLYEGEVELFKKEKGL